MHAPMMLLAMDLLVAGVASADQPVKLAVPDMAAVGVDASIGKILTELMVTDVSRLAGISVVTTSDIVAMLGHEKDRQLLGCAENLTCMAEIGGALGVDFLLVATVGRLGDTHVLNLKLIEVKRAEVRRRVSKTTRGEEDALIGAMREAVAEVIASLDTSGAAPVAASTAAETGSTDRAAAVPEPTAPAVAPTTRATWPQWTLVGLGGGLLLAGTLAEVWAKHEYDRAYEAVSITESAGPYVHSPETLDRFDNAKRGGKIGAALLVSGGLVAGGGLLWWWLARDVSTASATTVAPLAGDVVGFVVGGEF